MQLTTVVYETDGAVARVLMNRPEKRNAQSMRLLEELIEALEAAQRDPAIHVIVVGGTGPSFSAGHDLREIANDPDMIAARSTVEGRYVLEREMYLDHCLKIRNLPKPTIARVQGACIAGGLMIACMCDLIIASEDATFSDPVLGLGAGAAAVEVLLHPWEMGARRAKEFLFLAETITAAEAKALGMVNRVVPPERLDEETMAVAHKIATMPPLAIQMTKKSINHALDRMGQRDTFEYHFLMHQLSHAAGEHGSGTGMERWRQP